MNTTNKTITIIIPVYNCEPYLEDCLDSVINQTLGLDKINVIIINDGSTDGGINILEKYHKEYPNSIMVINRKNSGLSITRNVGLDLVKTKYVFFLDSDDILTGSALVDLLESATKNDSDVVIGGIENFTSSRHYPNYTTEYLKNIDSVSRKDYVHLLDFVHAQGKLYKTEAIEKLRFIPGVKHEDNYFTLSLYLGSNKISMIDKIVYYKREREGNDKSIVQSLNFNTFKDLLTNYGKVFDENECDDKTKKLINRKIANYIFKQLKPKDWPKALRLAKEFRNKYRYSKIDFVITWVDGSDAEWLKEKRKYEAEAGFTNDNRKARYRELGTLKYWFRSVEKNAPWVNKIYFLTWGHIPKWLNTDNKKIVIVKHSDFIPKKYLPTFNSCAIEMNMHRIKGLSENFVYFNDDMFVLNKTKQNDFFKKGLPKDTAILSAITPSGGKDMFEHRLVNNSTILNRHYLLPNVLKTHPFKWFNPIYGTKQLQSILLAFKKRFSTIRITHIPASLQKKTFERLWDEEKDSMENTSSKRFRDITCVNPWVAQGIQMASGNFYPRSPKFGKIISISDDMTNVCKTITNGKEKLLCVNDSVNIEDTDRIEKELIEAFDKKFPNKSEFER